MSSDGGVMLLSLAERRLGVAERLARCIPDRRDRSRIAHTIADMIRARVFAICCGYEDADDLDDLRSDPAFKLACGETLYCARGQAENLMKLHKARLASDRTSCRSALANQVRLVLHTAAYWLMLAVRDAIPKSRDLAKAEFATLRLRLLKIAARVVEMPSRVRLAFAAGSRARSGESPSSTNIIC